MKTYLQSRFEIVFILLLFIAVFFQTFQYPESVFSIVRHFPYLLGFIFIILQLFGIEKLKYDKTLFKVYILFIFWIMYGLLTTFFAHNHDLNLSVIHLRFATLVIVYVMSQFLCTDKRIKAFEYILLFCIIWNIGIALWEITTFQHFPKSNYYEMASYMPTGTFENENALACIFLISSPFLFFAEKKIKINLFVTVLVILLFMLFATGARMALIVFTPFVLIIFIKKTKILYKTLVILTVIFIINSVFTKYPTVKFLVQNHINRQVLSLGTEMESQRIGSTEARLELMRLSLDDFIDSKGFGRGVGSFEKNQTPDRYTKTGNAYSPHNIFFEALAEEGLIGFVLLFFILFLSLKPLLVKEDGISLWNLIRFKTMTQNEKKLLLALLFYLVGTLTAGSPRYMHIFSFILGYIYALGFNKTEDL